MINRKKNKSKSLQFHLLVVKLLCYHILLSISRSFVQFSKTNDWAKLDMKLKNNYLVFLQLATVMRQDHQATIVTQLLDNAPARKTLPETNATNPLPDTTTFLSLKVISQNFFSIFNFYSGLPKAEVFGRSRSIRPKPKFSLFGLQLWPPKFKSKYK